MNRRPTIGAVVGLTIGACVSIPAFNGGDAGGDGVCIPDLSVNGSGSVSFTSDSGGGIVTGAAYSLHFGSGSQFHFPDDVRVGGTDVMNAQTVNCGQEDLAGMALYPADAIRPNGSSMVGANDLIVQPGWTGPAVVKVMTHWSASFASCNATPGGDTLFTLFPEGRVVRHDYMYNNTSQDWGACACNGAASYYPTSFWTFDQASFTTLQVGSSSAVPLSTFTGQLADESVACLQGGPAISVATAWHVGGTTGTRVLEVNNAIAYVFDFVRVHQPTTAPAFGYTTTSALFLGGGCDMTGIPRATDFVANSTEITINGSPRKPGLADGIYGGADDRSNAGGFALTQMTAQIAGSAPVGFAVWLKFPAPACDITVTKNPDPGNPFFTKQQLDDDEWVVWFRDPLVAPNTITITAK